MGKACSEPRRQPRRFDGIIAADEVIEMRKVTTVLVALGAGCLLAACGHNTEQRAATGAVAGAVVAGPVGAAVGGAAGAAVSKAADKNPH